MKTFTKCTIITIATLLLIGCHSNPLKQPTTHEKITGFTPFGVAGGYDVGSLIDYSNRSYKTLFTSEYIEQNAKPEARDTLYKLFHTPLIPVSPRYNNNQKKQFMNAIKLTLLTGDFGLSNKAKAAIQKIYKVDISVKSAVKKTSSEPDELQHKLIEAIPSRGGVIIGIASKTGMAKTPVAITSILAFNQATVTIYFDSSVSADERIEILDKVYFDDRVIIQLGSAKTNSINIRYTKPTVVAFKGYKFDTESVRFYRKFGRLPTPKESRVLTTARQKQAEKENRVLKKRSVNQSDMYNVPWD